MEKYLIINADDFGASSGVNRGILETHTCGVVTSTSLMVYGQGAEEAAAISRDYPLLAVGLHWDVWGEGEMRIDGHDPNQIRDEFRRQLDLFVRLMGRLPTHVDSHRNIHREGHINPVFRQLVQPLGLPLRAEGGLRFRGYFYAQWEWNVTELDRVSVPFLQNLIRTEVPPGFTEISCHPGYVTEDYWATYLHEREAEIATLTDPRIRQTIDEENIRLISYADYGAAMANQPQPADPRA